MIDIEKEKPLSLAEATRVMPKIDGKKLHVSTLWRWCKKGLRGVRLEHIRIGHRVCTSYQAISRFVNALADVEALTTSDIRAAAPQYGFAPGSIASINHSKDVLAKAGI